MANTFVICSNEDEIESNESCYGIFIKMED